jgi:threonine/homoserine/homoserine lactone efflux protein
MSAILGIPNMIFWQNVILFVAGLVTFVMAVVQHMSLPSPISDAEKRDMVYRVINIIVGVYLMVFSAYMLYASREAGGITRFEFI